MIENIPRKSVDFLILLLIEFQFNNELIIKAQKNCVVEKTPGNIFKRKFYYLFDK